MKNDKSFVSAKLENGKYGYTLAKKGSKKGVPIKIPRQMCIDFGLAEIVYVKFQGVFEEVVGEWKKSMEKYNEEKGEKKLSKSEERRLTIQKR